MPTDDSWLRDPDPNPTSPVGQDEMRERVIRLAFGGEPARFDEFVRVLAEATPPGTEVILRGSAVTGHEWGSDKPFDAKGPGTSDLDVTFVGGDMIRHFHEYHILGVHSVPLGEDHPDAAPSLLPLRERLCAMVGRPVNLQATLKLVQEARDLVLEQPYLVLVRKPDAGDASHASHASHASRASHDARA